MNPWLHALVVIAIATPVLALALVLAAHAPAPWDEPARALAFLCTGLGFGWFTRRHPLLVGAAVGLLAMAWATGPMAAPLLTSGMVVAVAALAGRALRHRYRPDPAASGPRGR